MANEQTPLMKEITAFSAAVERWSAEKRAWSPENLPVRLVLAGYHRLANRLLDELRRADIEVLGGCAELKWLQQKCDEVLGFDPMMAGLEDTKGG